MSDLKSLPGRLRAWLQGLRIPAASHVRAPTGASPDRARDLSGEFERFMAIGERLERGLEALKDIQWEIRENEARYRDLLDNQTDLILRRDKDGCLTFVNQAFCRVFGIDRSAVLGRPFAPRVLAGDRATPLAPGGDLAPAALRAGDRDRSRPALVRVGRAHRSGPRGGDPGGAMPRPRHHRAAPRPRPS